MIARMGSATARVPIEKSSLFRAPLFEQLLDQLSALRRWVVLDLGISSTPLLERLAGLRTRIEVADLAGSGALDLLSRAAPAAELEAIATEALKPHDAGSPFDVVLCWDLLNYLSPGGMAALMTVIDRRASPGALAHGLLAYADAEMPAEPRRYGPADDGHLASSRIAAAMRPAPRYTPEALSRTMGRFALERAVLLSNGMQEMLFRLQ